MPDDAALICPGRRFASATNSSNVRQGRLAFTTNSVEPTDTREICVKSRIPSKGMPLWYRYLFASRIVAPPRNSVCPSGALRATASPAMLPPAPGRLSIITVWPSSGPMRSATRRAVISAAPAGGKGTTRRKGRVGKPCARAMAGAARPAINAARRVMLIMLTSLLYFVGSRCNSTTMPSCPAIAG